MIRFFVFVWKNLFTLVKMERYSLFWVINSEKVRGGRQWCTKPKVKESLFRLCLFFCRTCCLLSPFSYIWCGIIFMVQSSSYYSYLSKSSLSDRFWGFLGMIQGADRGFFYLIHGVTSCIEWDNAIISIRLNGASLRIFSDGVVRCSHKLTILETRHCLMASATWWDLCVANEWLDEVDTL